MLEEEGMEALTLVKDVEAVRKEIRDGCHLMMHFDEELQKAPPGFLLQPDAADPSGMRQNLMAAAVAIVSTFSGLIGHLQAISSKGAPLCSNETAALSCSHHPKADTLERIKSGKNELKMAPDCATDHQGSADFLEEDSPECIEPCANKKRKFFNSELQDMDPHPDDGYSWRKYGQKDILGSKHPRSYYRCSFRAETGCRAVKHVQKSDDDPLVFKVLYKGRHICSQAQMRNTSRQRQSCPTIQSFHHNSACLTINSDGNLQVGSSGPTISVKQESRILFSKNRTGTKEKQLGSSSLSQKIATQKVPAMENLGESEVTGCSSIESPKSVQSANALYSTLETEPQWIMPSWLEESAKTEEARIDQTGISSSDLQVLLLDCLSSEGQDPSILESWTLF